MSGLGVASAALVACAAWLTVPPLPADRAARLSGRGAPAWTAERMQREVGRWLHRLGIGPAARRRRTRERLGAIHALVALAGELTAGQPPQVALASAAGEPPVWPSALAAARLGDDVAAGLDLDAERHPILRQLAACWRVAMDSGSGLAEAVTALAEAARSAEDIRVQLEAELAGPRATARTLAVLPVAGLGFGTMLGGDPVGWLLGTPAGLACLAGGLVLTGAGYAWTGRIAARVESML